MDHDTKGPIIVGLRVDYEAGNDWWEAGGLDLWQDAALCAYRSTDDDVLLLTATEARAFWCEAQKIGPPPLVLISDAREYLQDSEVRS